MSCSVVSLIPGSQGAAGADGTNGTNGVNAFTTASAFTMPAELGTVTITVGSTAWMALSQILWIIGGGIQGYFKVTAIVSSTQVTIQNLESTAAGTYAPNSATGSVFPNLSQVVAAGIQGPTGAATAGALLAANNLSDVANVATSRTNLGLSTGATVTVGVANTNVPPVDTNLTNGNSVFATATGLQTKSAFNARTALGLAINTDVQAYDVGLQSLSAFPTAADKMVYSTAADVWAELSVGLTSRTLLQQTTTPAWRQNLGYVRGGYGKLGSINQADLNSGATDTAIAIEATKYRIDKVTLSSPSVSMTTATCGLFTAAGGGGTTLAADQAVSALSATTKFRDLTLQAVAGTDAQTAATVYFRVGTAQGVAARADVSVWGWVLDTSSM